MERHILIIDDSEEDRAILRRSLKQVPQYRYTFSEVDLGEPALRLCETFTPTCILLDYHLPDMSGLDFLEELRHSQSDMSYIPVIMLTGHGSEYIAVQAMKYGAQDYIKKHDYTFDRLHTCINNAVEFMQLKADLHRSQAQTAELLRLEKLARKDADDANHQKIRFMGIISHELASPLASVKLLANSMLTEKATLDQSQRILRLIANEADRMYDLASQLQDLSRMQLASLTIHQEEKSILDVIEGLRLQLSTIASNHTLIFNIADHLPLVCIDTRRIMQVVVNLVNNAVKFSPVGTTITLTIFAIERGIQIEIGDEGIGIPPDKRDVVFEAYQQIVGPNQYKGAGLGLAICKGIIEAHGGQIWIDKNTSTGTTFCFKLPTISNNV